VAAHATFFILFFLVLIASHAPVLDLPYFWDEMGQFIPASLDILQLNAWVPKTTLPNVHPPGAMAYLAAFWVVFGYSVAVTRVAMLVMAAAGLLAVFALAIELMRNTRGPAALPAVALLLASPLFWAQSMMAQLDMPAMVFTALGLLLFLRERYLASALACVVLVLMKETGLVVPAVFGAVLLWERRVRSALLFILPAAALAGWLSVLYFTTGHLLGNAEFSHYNVTFQLHPVRLPVTIVRRVFYLFVDNFHWVGTIAILLAWRRTSIFRNRAWAVTLAVAAVHTTVVSVFGGAALERYLMPVLPLFYIAVASAWSTFRPKWRAASAAVMTVGLVVGIFVSPPFTYPFENNSAFVTFVRLQQTAADFVAAEFPGSAVVSAWPFPDALRRREFGYVDRPMQVRGLHNFDPETVRAEHARAPVNVLVLYSRTWEPRWSVLEMPWIRAFLTDYYFYKPQVTEAELAELGLSRVARWERGGQWVEVYARGRSSPDVAL
jgi:4-amino-4-deoxy-L-arabinose transferase-like glycosyltransferase